MRGSQKNFRKPQKYSGGLSGRMAQSVKALDGRFLQPSVTACKLLVHSSNLPTCLVKPVRKAFQLEQSLKTCEFAADRSHIKKAGLHKARACVGTCSTCRFTVNQDTALPCVSKTRHLFRSHLRLLDQYRMAVGPDSANSSRHRILKLRCPKLDGRRS